MQLQRHLAETFIVTLLVFLSSWVAHSTHTLPIVHPHTFAAIDAYS